MKIAITTAGNTLASPFDPRFGRAASFCIVDTETDIFQVFPNPALSASGGAGVQAAQFVAGQGVQAAISGAFGPNAFDTLAAAGIEMYIAPGDKSFTVAEIEKMFKAGQFTRAEAATHEGHHGDRHG